MYAYGSFLKNNLKYDDWMTNLKVILFSSSSVESFACKVSWSLEEKNDY